VFFENAPFLVNSALLFKSSVPFRAIALAEKQGIIQFFARFMLEQCSKIKIRFQGCFMSNTELECQLNDSVKQLSPQKLQVLADFAAYLVNVESEAATQELLAIPGLLERIKQNQATPKTDYTNWRNIRSDV
jgi:hypothetical protein